MKRRQAGNYKGRAVYVIGGLALCSIIGLLGLYAYKTNEAPKQPNVVDLNEVANAEEKTNTKPKRNDTQKNESTKSSEKEIALTEDSTKKKEADTTAASDTDSEKKKETDESVEPSPSQTDPAESEPATQETSANATSISFPEGETLMWPVSGNVLMNYSMDGTIYFETLDQYKYNPALIIQSSVNTNVLSATDGIVESVASNEETGLTMTVDLGNGYKAVYGQIKENQVEEGDYIEKGTIIGFINEPTKYYSTEGTNLYFKLMKDDQPINPADYFE